MSAPHFVNRAERAIVLRQQQSGMVATLLLTFLFLGAGIFQTGATGSALPRKIIHFIYLFFPF